MEQGRKFNNYMVKRDTEDWWCWWYLAWYWRHSSSLWQTGLMICSSSSLFISSCCGQQLPGQKWGVTKTFRLSTVMFLSPARTLVTSGNVMLGTFHTKILILQTFMEFCNCFFILQFSYVMAQVHNCQTKNGASWTSWTGPKLLRIGANVDLTRWKVRLSGLRPL